MQDFRFLLHMLLHNYKKHKRNISLYLFNPQRTLARLLGCAVLGRVQGACRASCWDAVNGTERCIVTALAAACVSHRFELSSGMRCWLLVPCPHAVTGTGSLVNAQSVIDTDDDELALPLLLVPNQCLQTMTYVTNVHQSHDHLDVHMLALSVK